MCHTYIFALFHLVNASLVYWLVGLVVLIYLVKVGVIIISIVMIANGTEPYKTTPQSKLKGTNIQPVIQAMFGLCTIAIGLFCIEK